MKTPSQAAGLVITGAPASGKTVFFERLRHVPKLKRFVFFDELARRLLTEDPTYRGRWGAFHREILRRQTGREDALGGAPFVTDRGTVDAFAFHPETAADVGTTVEAEFRRYHAVIQLGSSAALGNDYYPTDAVRTESTGEALDIEAAIRRIWEPHPRYFYLEACPSLEVKYTKFETLVLELAKEIVSNI